MPTPWSFLKVLNSSLNLEIVSKITSRLLDYDRQHDAQDVHKSNRPKNATLD